MTHDEYEKFVEKSILYRGKILHDITILEQVLNFYIAKHFCGDDQKKNYDMQLLLLNDDRMNFNHKTPVFQYIAVNYDEKWYKSYKSIRATTPGNAAYTLSQDLAYAIEQRNIFAHRVLNGDDYSSNQPPSATIKFIRFNNEIQIIEYSDAKFIELSNLINSMTDYIGQKM
ncbi:hypothetical protein HH214_08075 [Mucilaginibacter robiniae]|uniref:Uncharacterized protein n=1 Tax=Mucilaginibacter robiniae TaxID=2728022 RepID=A0A7L5DXJ4_9SPHI|nr:hypothetical protein [Mucilaginibacter robiniae]QJD95832.1 hypothetical protein HH214_08075 [Mucilaginibacter robiniae]